MVITNGQRSVAVVVGGGHKWSAGNGIGGRWWSHMVGSGGQWWSMVGHKWLALVRGGHTWWSMVVNGGQWW